MKGTKCSLLDNNQSWFDAVSRGTAKFKVYSDWADSGGYSNCDTTFLSKNILRSNPAYIAAAIVHENGHAISTSEESSSFSINLIRIIKKIIDWESAAVLYLLQKPVLPIMQTNPEQWISGSFFGWQSASEKTANYYAIRFMSDAKQGDLLAASEGILARKKLLNYTYGLELQDANYEKIASGVAGVFWGGALLLHALAAGALLSLGRFFSKLAGAAVKGLRNENPQLPASPI
ncbi:MAG: hypothetical protein NTX79_08575 [Candidatus Micrarchaeota archaeon]|nr:hypothetical protein [Candidatus Micrarchaeota archaeon]